MPLPIAESSPAVHPNDAGLPVMRRGETGDSLLALVSLSTPLGALQTMLGAPSFAVHEGTHKWFWVYPADADRAFLVVGTTDDAVSSVQVVRQLRKHSRLATADGFALNEPASKIPASYRISSDFLTSTRSDVRGVRFASTGLNVHEILRYGIAKSDTGMPLEILYWSRSGISADRAVPISETSGGSPFGIEAYVKTLADHTYACGGGHWRSLRADEETYGGVVVGRRVIECSASKTDLPIFFALSARAPTEFESSPQEQQRYRGRALAGVSSRTLTRIDVGSVRPSATSSPTTAPSPVGKLWWLLNAGGTVSSSTPNGARKLASAGGTYADFDLGYTNDSSNPIQQIVLSQAYPPATGAATQYRRHAIAAMAHGVVHSQATTNTIFSTGSTYTCPASAGTSATSNAGCKPSQDSPKVTVQGALCLQGQAQYGSGSTAYVVNSPISCSQTATNTMQFTRPHCSGSADAGYCPASVANIGRPVDIVSGSLWHEHSDARMSGPFGLEFRRRYDSSDPLHNTGLGYGWHHSYDAYLSIAQNSPNGQITYFDVDGHPQSFQTFGAGSSSYDAAAGSTLVTNGDGSFTLTTWNEGVLRFDSAGNLLSITDRTGNTQTVARDAQHRITSVTDPLGRSLSFAYVGSSANIAKVTSVPAGVNVSFTYGSGSGNCYTGELCTATESDNAVWSYQYLNPSSVGGYHLLSQVLDPLSHVEESNAYVANSTSVGAPYQVSQQSIGGAGNVDVYGFQYADSPTTESSVVVTDYRTTSSSAKTQYYVDEFNQAVVGVSGYLCHCEDGALTYTLDNWGRVLTSSGDATVTYSYGRDQRSPTFPDGTSYIAQPYLGVTETDETGLHTLPSVGTTRTLTYSYYPLGDVRHDLVQEIDEPSVSVSTGKTRTLRTYDTTGLLDEVSRIGYVGTTATTYDACATYDARGRLLTTTATFDAALVAGCAQAPQITRYAYFSDSDSALAQRGQLQTITNPLGQAVSLVAPAAPSYDVYGDPYAVTDPNGVRKLFTFDALGRPSTSAIDTSTGGVSAYLPASNPSTKQSVAYDAAGKIQSYTRGTSGKVVATFNDSDSLTAITNVDSAGLQRDQLAYQYDPLTRPTAVTASGCGTPAAACSAWNTTFQQSYVYDPSVDPSGVLTSINYAGGGSTKFKYDNIGNLSNWTTGDSNYSVSRQTNFDTSHDLELLNNENIYLDLQHNLASIVPFGNGLVYAHDDFGRVTSLTDETGGKTSYTYDARGNPLSRTDADGNVTTNTYDNLSRLTATTASYGSTTDKRTYAYDSTTAGHFGIGRLASMTDATGSTSFWYEPRGLLASEGHVVGAATYATTYGYDADGDELTEQRGNSGLSLTYAYDYADRPVSLSAAEGGVTTTFVSSATYAPFGPIQTLKFGNGVTQARTYTQRYAPLENKVTAGNGTVLQDLTYSVYGTGQIQSIIDQVNGQYSWTALTYGNAAGAGIKEVDSPNWTSAKYNEYTGELIQNVALGGATPRSETQLYDGYNRMSSVSDSGGGNTVTYDAMSNEITYGTTKFTYSPRNLLASETNAVGAFGYAYDGLNRRTTTSTPKGSYASIYDSSRRLIEESFVGQAAAGHDFLWFGSLPVGQIEQNGHAAYWTTTNHLGAPSLLTNAAGTAAWQSDYEPFGRVYDMRSNTVHQPLRFPGQQTISSSDGPDATGNGQTALVSNDGRWLHQNLGRYSQPDPLGYGPNHFNRFDYVENDPVNTVDPSGLDPFDFVNGAASYATFGLSDALDDSDVDYAGPSYKIGGALAAVAGLSDGNSELHAAVYLGGLVFGNANGDADGSSTLAAYNGSASCPVSFNSAVGPLQTMGSIAKTSSRKGSDGEADVRDVYDIGDKPTIPIQMIRGKRLPDGINPDLDTLSEVKNVASLSLTSQIKDYRDYALQNKLTFNLYTRPTTYLTGPLRDEILAGTISRIDIP